MDQHEVSDILREVGAVIVDDHIVYTSGMHGRAYVNKDALYPNIEATNDLCLALARQFETDQVEVVLSPAVGGVVLTQWVAHHLEVIMDTRVFAVYAEKETMAIPDPKGIGRKCFLETGAFVLKRGYDKLVHGRKVLVLEDILTTGGTARKVVELARSVGGNVVGVGALCNRGGITADDLAGVPELVTLLDLKLEAWNEEDCPLCKEGVPVNTQVGKGREFVERRRAQE